METEEKLCIKVLRTLQQMLVKRNKYGERVSTVIPWHVLSPAPCLCSPCFPGWQCFPPRCSPRVLSLVLL